MAERRGGYTGEKIDIYRQFPTDKKTSLYDQQKIKKLSDWKWDDNWVRLEQINRRITILQKWSKACGGFFGIPGNDFGKQFIAVKRAETTLYFGKPKFYDYVGFRSYIWQVRDAVFAPLLIWTSTDPRYDTSDGTEDWIMKEYIDKALARAKDFKAMYQAGLDKELALFTKLFNAADTPLVSSLDQTNLGTLASDSSSKKGGGSGGGNTDPKKKWISKGQLDMQAAVYNVGSVKEAYFRPRNKEEDQANGNSYIQHNKDGSTTKVLSGWADKVGLNSPSAVDDASELWGSDIMGSKGMIQTYFPPDGFVDTADSAGSFSKTTANIKYAFQFLYNPASISMQYMGTTDTDVSYQMSGKDRFNYTPNAGTSASITFSVMLNRVHDMKYYDPDTQHLTPEALKSNLYAPRNPYGEEKNPAGFDEQKAIYNKGTMYDVEFLMRTLLGYTMSSQLRNEQTADMGFFARRQVELHLGPNLRYRGFVNSLQVNHVMFNERMVPTSSSVSISFSRYPDYPIAALTKAP